jgi:hypothetical protein
MRWKQEHNVKLDLFLFVVKSQEVAEEAFTRVQPRPRLPVPCASCQR